MRYLLLREDRRAEKQLFDEVTCFYSQANLSFSFYEKLLVVSALFGFLSKRKKMLNEGVL